MNHWVLQRNPPPPLSELPVHKKVLFFAPSPKGVVQDDPPPPTVGQQVELIQQICFQKKKKKKSWLKCEDFVRREDIYEK